MVHLMKLCCLRAAADGPNPHEISAADAVQAAAIGRTAAEKFVGKVGEIKEISCSDLTVFAMSGQTFVPRSGVIRQMVFRETGPGLEARVIGGRAGRECRRCTPVICEAG